MDPLPLDGKPSRVSVIGAVGRIWPGARMALCGAFMAAACALFAGHAAPARADTLEGIHNIQHVVVIMQENRSFDSYFGTYPGRQRDPRPGRVPRRPAERRLQRALPRPERKQLRRAARRGARDRGRSTAGRWTASSARGRAARHRAQQSPLRPERSRKQAPADVMGYHDAREIPNYWTYAKNFVLQDNMFESGRLVEPARAPLHGLRLVGAVPQRPTPQCTAPALRRKPGSLTRTASTTVTATTTRGPTSPTCSPSTASAGATTSSKAREPDCEPTKRLPARRMNRARRPRDLEPAAGLHRRPQDGQLENIQSLEQLLQRRRQTRATLPNVSWIAPTRSHRAPARARLRRARPMSRR